jgi:hypothetical protein
MTTPSILLRPGVSNETQDMDLTTVKLTPNSHSNFQSRFMIPVNGDLLDSNSSLVWRISWEGFDAAEFQAGNEIVSLKTSCGGLPTLQRARFYVDGKEIFSCEDVGHLIHIRNLANNPDYKEEVQDIELGSVQGYFQERSDNGKYKLSADGDFASRFTGRYVRALGKYSDTPSDNTAIECSVLLSDIFSALQSVQLPMTLKDMRIEFDWNTTFDDVAFVAVDKSNNISASDKTIAIKDPVLLLDYLTVDDDSRAGLSEALKAGQVLPYVHTSISEKVIPANATATDQTTDVHLALQGKLLMKMYISHRLNDTNAAGAVQAPQIFNGRCRSQRNVGFEYNLFVNDLAIHDLPVELDSEQYAYMDMALESPQAIIPGGVKHNSSFGAALANTQVNSGLYTISGVAASAAGGSSLSDLEIRDGVAGTQAYIGFDLAKYDTGSRVVPANAGYRVGSSPVIFRVKQTGSATADSQQARAKRVEVFAEEVKLLQIFDRSIEITDA